MSNISKQHIGKYTYLYESESYRDELGRPRNKKLRIGKLDLVTGEPVYLPEYIKRMAANGTPVIMNTVTTTTSTTANDDVIHVLDSIKDYGVFWFLKATAEKIGLWDIIQKTFPSIWQELFTLACYLIVADKPVMYCDDWVSSNECLAVGSMSSQRISELLAGFGSTERYQFYREWSGYIREREYIALDITSVSSYSTQISECEWGHNRDGENLQQVNLCMLFGESSHLPVYQTEYSGSLSDVVTLENTMSEFCNLLAEPNILIVMDKGFFSAKNIDMLLKKEIKFLLSVSFTSKFARQQVASEAKDIDRIANVIHTSSSPIRGIYKYRVWRKDVRLHTHVFFNPEKALKERNQLFEHVSLLKDLAEKDPGNKKHAAQFKRFLNIRHSSNADCGYTVNVNDKAVAKSLETAGWFVFVSNDIVDTQKAYDIYRMKDVVEKGFWKYKNNLGLERMRVHSNTRMHNKSLVAFIALILASHVHNVMKENKMYKSMTFDRLFITLAKIKSATVNGQKFIRPLTKQQREIFQTFKFPLPVV